MLRLRAFARSIMTEQGTALTSSPPGPHPFAVVRSYKVMRFLQRHVTMCDYLTCAARNNTLA